MEHKRSALKFLNEFETAKKKFIESLINGGEEIKNIELIIPAIQMATQALQEIGHIYNLKFKRAELK